MVAQPLRPWTPSLGPLPSGRWPSVQGPALPRLPPPCAAVNQRCTPACCSGPCGRTALPTTDWPIGLPLRHAGGVALEVLEPGCPMAPAQQPPTPVHAGPSSRVPSSGAPRAWPHNMPEPALRYCWGLWPTCQGARHHHAFKQDTDPLDAATPPR